MTTVGWTVAGAVLHSCRLVRLVSYDARGPVNGAVAAAHGARPQVGARAVDEASPAVGVRARHRLRDPADGIPGRWWGRSWPRRRAAFPGARDDSSPGAAEGRGTINKSRIQVVRQYTPILRGPAGEAYVGRAYMDRQPGGLWRRLARVLLAQHRDAPSPPTARSTQGKREHVLYWATGLGPTYLQGLWSGRSSAGRTRSWRGASGGLKARRQYALREAEVYTRGGLERAARSGGGAGTASSEASERTLPGHARMWLCGAARGRTIARGFEAPALPGRGGSRWTGCLRR